MPERKNVKLTNEDAQAAILANAYQVAMEKEMPPSVRAKKWKKLANAKETKVFHNEGEVVYSDKVEALQIQVRAMENISKQMGDYPVPGISFEGANGEKVTFEMHFGGREEDVANE